MTDIKPGDEVVCINAEVFAEQYIEIKAGETYKVRWVGACGSYLHGEYLGVRLEGIHRGVCPQFGEEDVPFRASRFRRVVKPATKKELEETV